MIMLEQQTFNKGETTVWFYIDNIKHFDDKKNIIEEKDKFICYYNFIEPSLSCLGEILKDSYGNINVSSTANNALHIAMNHVIHKFKLEA